MVLLRADDLGYSKGINYGIAETVKSGMIKNVGLMPNMSAAEHGVSLVAGAALCIGQHTNISVGRPLTSPDKIPSLVTESGEFKPSSMYRAAKEDFVVLDEVLLEIEAQYRRFVELVGRKPDYIECHAVSSKNLFLGLEEVAKKYGLKYSPISPMPLDDKPVTIGATKVFMTMDAMRPEYNPFASLTRMVENAHPDGCAMMVFHPGFLDNYLLKTSSLTTPRAIEVEMLCDPATREWLEQHHVVLATYHDL
ncbi:MAG: ChbG/HpnK family deacetylase [Spirochaetaceae bacterium]|jgi:predicted glycoside hydrolase/deacetylase ChbG (UPF0249 family)|nr:ChbG/HpnK family deacetylase [Spirochaetaceae bacterium]